MTKDITLEIRDRQEQRSHELKIAVINAFAKDPELKYYVGVAVGAGVASIAALFGDAVEGGTSSVDQTQKDKGTWVGATVGGTGVKVKVGWDWLVPAIAAVSPGAMVSNVGIAGVAAWMTGTPEGQEAAKNLGFPQTLAGILSLGGAGFSGFCGMILILKAIFGEKGASDILSKFLPVIA